MDAIKAEIAILKTEHTVVLYVFGDLQASSADSCSAADDDSPPDLLIICQSFKFAVHEAIMSPKVGFIAQALQVDMKVKHYTGLRKLQLTNEQEKEERKIDVPAQDPLIIQAMIHWAYTGRFGIQGNDQAQDTPLVFLANVYALAEEYQAGHLKTLAASKFKIEMAAMDSDKSVDAHKLIDAVYTMTPADDRGLREPLIREVCKRWSYWERQPRFHDGLDSFAMFTAETSRRLAPTRPLERKWGGSYSHDSCPTCKAARLPQDNKYETCGQCQQFLFCG